MSLNSEVTRAKAAGDQPTTLEEFGAVRSLENLNLELNDTWVMPENPQCFCQTFQSGGKAYYFFIELENKHVKKFYPSVFTKRRRVYNENKTPADVEPMVTSGSAAEEYRKHQKVADGIKALAGKTLKVTEIKSCRTLRYGTTDLITAQIPVIEIIEPTKK